MRLLRILVRKIRTAANLPPTRLWGIASAWVLLTLVQLSIYALPYRVWKKRLNAALNANSKQTLKPREILRCRQLAQDVSIAARNHLLKTNCLGKSLALHLLCRRRGYAIKLIIGIRKTPEDIHGHAWLEAGGLVLNDTESVITEFTRLERLPGSQPTFPV